MAKSLSIYILLLSSGFFAYSIANEVDEKQIPENPDYPRPPCTLFSNSNFSEKFIGLYDGQSIQSEDFQDLEWNLTLSIYVSNGCILTVCETPDNNCKDVDAGNYYEIREDSQEISYAKCFCKFDHINYGLLTEMKATIEKQGELIEEIKDQLANLSISASAPPVQTRRAGSRYRRSTVVVSAGQNQGDIFREENSKNKSTEETMSNTNFFPKNFVSQFSILFPQANGQDENVSKGEGVVAIGNWIFGTFNKIAEKIQSAFNNITNQLNENYLKSQQKADERWEQFLKQQKEERDLWIQQQQPHYKSMNQMEQRRLEAMERFREANQQYESQQSKHQLPNSQWNSNTNAVNSARVDRY